MDKTKETYYKLNARMHKEVNELPLHFAFGDKQWKALLEKLGITEEEASEKLIAGPAGSVILKKDKDIVLETLRRHDRELKEAMQDMEFFKDAVIYEMGNREYHINYQGDYDVLTALGFECEYENEIASSGMTEEQVRTYKEAKSEFLRMADENGWY